jgi:hypothetical protein
MLRRQGEENLNPLSVMNACQVRVVFTFGSGQATRLRRREPGCAASKLTHLAKASMTPDASRVNLEMGRDGASEFEATLYLRYVTALVLLCECAPYVDELDYLERISDVLEEARGNYPLEWRRDGGGFEIGPRTAFD